MNETTIIRSPEVIAAEINAIKRTTVKYVLEQSIEIGRLLCEAKAAVPYGEWGKWLEENCAYSTSNANNLMRIYTEYGEDSQLTFFEENKLELYGNLTRSQAVALLALPSAERAEFVKENNVESMSVSELEAKIKEAKETARDETEAEYAEKLQAAQSKITVAETERKNAESARDKAMKEYQKAKDKILTLSKVQEELKEITAERDKLQEQLSLPAEITPEQRAEIAAAAETAVKAEYEETLKQMEAMNAKLKAAANPTMQKFMGLFEAWQEDWNRMWKVIAACDEEEMQYKLRNVLSSMLGRMQESIGNGKE